MTSSEHIHALLKQYWGYDSFRPIQQDIIQSVLDKHDTLALLPTGGGKSICFQLPALALGGTCLVVSPLIALMNDQVHNLKKRGISAVAITSAMNVREIDIALTNAAFGHVSFLYVSPERIENETFRKQLTYLPIKLIAVDEAHCVSQWGYDFRPSYLKIAEIREYFPDITIIALTASATTQVIKDIQEKLQFKKQKVHRQSFERKNIHYVVQKEEDKWTRLLKIIHNIGGTGVIYVRNRRKTEDVTKLLVKQGIKADFYHAGLDSVVRQKKQDAWINNQSQVIVATNAFGMGIDKADVRFVVHLDLPDSLEAYFQEAGRAGRDEKPAYAVLLYDGQDVNLLKQNFDESFPSLEEIKHTYQAICNYYQVAIGSGEGLSVEFDINDVCKNYNLKPIKVFNAIKFLQREDYLSYIDSHYEPSRVMVLTNKEELYKFQVRFPKNEQLIKTLLRSYGGLFEQYVSINEKDIAYRCKHSIDDTIQQLKLLHEHEIISYIPQTSLPQLIFLKDRINTKYVEFDYINYQFLKDRVEEKHTSVIHYVEETAVCRSRLLLTYFDETNTQDCGYCDVCVGRKNKDTVSEQIVVQLKKVLARGPLSLDDVNKQLQQFNTKTLIDCINQLVDDGVIDIDNNKLVSLT